MATMYGLYHTAVPKAVSDDVMFACAIQYATAASSRICFTELP